MENHLFEITRSVDWPASIRALREMSRDPASWTKALADDKLIAWSRLLGCYALFLDVEGHPAGEILREHLDALSAEVRRRPRVRNLAGPGHVRTVEAETRPPSARTKTRRRAATRRVVAELGKVGVAPRPEDLTGALELIAQDRTAAPEHRRLARSIVSTPAGQPRLLSRAESNAIVRGRREGLTIQAMARALALGVKPRLDTNEAIAAWIEEVRPTRRKPGRPRKGSPQPDPEEAADVSRIRRAAERTLQQAAFYGRVVGTGTRIGREWPIKRTSSS